MSGNASIQARAGANAGVVPLTAGFAYDTVKPVFLAATSLADTVLAVGDADEYRTWPAGQCTYYSINIRNDAGFAVDVSAVLIRAGHEIPLATITAENGTSSTLSISGSNPFLLRDASDSVVIRVAKNGGGGDVASGVHILSSWGDLNAYENFVRDVDVSDTRTTIFEVPAGAVCDLGTGTLNSSLSGLVINNFDGVQHTFQFYLNKDGTDILVDSVAVNANKFGLSVFFLSSVNCTALDSGWKLKCQLTEPVDAVEPSVQFIAIRRDSHD